MIPHRNFSKCIAASAVLRIAKRRPVADRASLPRRLRRCNPRPRTCPLTDRSPSKPRAALWMAGWLTLMLVVAVAGREATRALNVFQIMEVRSILGFFMLYPLIHLNGGFAAMT